jgi:hypothetical protein
MKKMIIPALCLFIATQASSQTAQSGKAAPHKAQSGLGLSAEKSKMLCKAWKLDSVEQFGVGQKANAKEANDGITFMADGTFFITTEGAPSNGTWKGNGAPYIYIAGIPAITKPYKLISLSDGKLKLEYQTEDLIRILYTYSPKS